MQWSEKAKNEKARCAKVREFESTRELDNESVREQEREEIERKEEVERAKKAKNKSKGQFARIRVSFW